MRQNNFPQKKVCNTLNWQLNSAAFFLAPPVTGMENWLFIIAFSNKRQRSFFL